MLTLQRLVTQRLPVHHLSPVKHFLHMKTFRQSSFMDRPLYSSFSSTSSLHSGSQQEVLKDSKGRTIVTTLTSPDFEAFYSAQRVVEDGQLATLMEACRKGLPSVFRSSKTPLRGLASNSGSSPHILMLLFCGRS